MVTFAILANCLISPVPNKGGLWQSACNSFYPPSVT